MLKAILIDDEPYCIELLAHLLKRHCPEVYIEAQFTDSVQALEYLRHNPEPDLLFLDVEMPKINAFDLLNHVYPFQFKVIFTTAYDKYGVRAVKLHAQDYLLKPIDIEELKIAVRNASQPKDMKIAASTALHVPDGEEISSNIARVGLSTSLGIDIIEVNQIIYCSASGSYTEITQLNGQKLVLSKSIKEIEEALPKDLFFRIHHSYLINLKQVKRYIRGTGGEVLMQNGQSLPVARSKKEAFLQLLGVIL